DRFTYHSTGYVGSMHDSGDYKNNYLYQRPEDYFIGKEYLLADAAYALTTTVIPRFTNAVGEGLTFNILHGSARVKVEHAFGMLKLKFQSLSNLSIKIISQRDIDHASIGS
ncbi:hypothetical protein BGZ72_009902, partial [Mortierella alpina]